MTCARGPCLARAAGLALAGLAAVSSVRAAHPAGVAGALDVGTWRGFATVAGAALVLWSSKR